MGATGRAQMADRTPDVWFQDVAQAAGVAAPHRNRHFENPYSKIMEGYTALGASASVADFDGDGFDDIFVTDSSVDGRNHLYRNRGDFTFEDVAGPMGVAAGNDAANASADSVWLDFNNDGHPDLFVVRFGHSQLFENRAGRFREITREAGLDRYLNAITAVAFDYDGDGDVDLFVGGYFQPTNLFAPDSPRFFPESFETANNGGGVLLFRNNGDGTFSDVTAKAGLTTSGWTLDLGHADADSDGDEDLFVACDFGTDRFFVNNGDGTFTDRTEAAVGIDTKKGWGARFFDYDNDGWLDLYVTNGWVSAGPDSYVPDIFEMIVRPDVDLTDARSWPPMGDKSLSGYERNKLYHNERGQVFTDQAARHGVDSIRDARGVAIADFDNDGRLDMFVANANASPHLYRNVGPRGAHWVQLVLEGTRSNRRATGAIVRATVGTRTLARFLDGGNSFAAQSTARIHFGLGPATRIDRLSIHWPSGRVDTLTDVPANAVLRVVEASGVATPLPMTKAGQ